MIFGSQTLNGQWVLPSEEKEKQFLRRGLGASK